MLTRELRLELNALSLEIFGVSSKWRKILDGGQVKLITRKTTETVPGENGAADTTREIEVPLLHSSGAHQSIIKQLTVDEVRMMLLGFKAQRDAILAEQKTRQAAAEAKSQADKLAKSVQDQISGSAI